MSSNITEAITNKAEVIALQANALDVARSTLATKVLPTAVIEPLSVTQSGTYTAPSGVDGYSPVTVNVSQGASIPNYNGLKSVKYFDLVVNANSTGYGIQAVGFIFHLARNTKYLFQGKNEAFTNPSVTSSWQSMGIVGWMTETNSNSGRGAINFTTMGHGGVASYGATNSNFTCTGTTDTVACTRAAFEGDATHQYYFAGTYRIYVFVYESGYTGSVDLSPATSSLVEVHPDYSATCSVLYPTTS